MNSGAETFFLTSNSRALLANWHGTAGEPVAAVLFCHPLGEEKKCAHRAFLETTNALQRRGVASLRFDMSGCGDSDGEFEQFRLADWLDDIEAAWSETGRRAPDARRILLGLRFGASLAAVATARLKNVGGLVLWQPIIDGKAEFSGDLRRVLIQQMITDGKAATDRNELIAQLESGEGAVEMDGYAVTGALYQDICRIDLATNRPECPEKVKAVQFSRPNRRIEAFAEAAGVESVVVDVPPIWIRSDFMPDQATGDALAETVGPTYSRNATDRSHISGCSEMEP